MRAPQKSLAWAQKCNDDTSSISQYPRIYASSFLKKIQAPMPDPITPHQLSPGVVGTVWRPGERASPGQASAVPAGCQMRAHTQAACLHEMCIISMTHHAFPVREHRKRLLSRPASGTKTNPDGGGGARSPRHDKIECVSQFPYGMNATALGNRVIAGAAVQFARIVTAMRGLGGREGRRERR